MPLRATSIMPVDVTAPTMIPTDATAMITRDGGRFGTDGRIEEVGGIVHHSDEETGHGEKRHGGQHKRIYRFHSVEFGQMRNKDSFFTRR